MGAPFEPSREDGRSDKRVIYELTSDAEPGSTYTYAELIEALQDGLDKPIQRDRVYRAVAAANATLLREHRRYLGVVPNVGYRMIRADEHLPESLRKKDRAQSHLRRGIELLRHARLDELTQAQRTLHEGQLMIMSHLYHAAEDSARRHERSERLIEDLLKSNRRMEDRLDRIDGGDLEGNDEPSAVGAPEDDDIEPPEGSEPR